MAEGHANSLYRQHNSTNNHSVNFYYQMLSCWDAEPIIRDPDRFHIYSYQLLSDGIIWYIISMVLVILLYVISWYLYHGFDGIENADLDLLYGVILILSINIFMVLTSYQTQGRGLYKIQMVLFHILRIHRSRIYRLRIYIKIERILYVVSSVMWLLLLTIYYISSIYKYLMNNIMH